MIELRRKQLVVDGVPRLVMAGEVHYFRVPHGQWEQRLDGRDDRGRWCAPGPDCTVRVTGGIGAISVRFGDEPEG